MTFISDLRKQAESRLKELEPAVREYEQLQRIVETFRTAQEPATEQPARSSTRRRRTAKRSSGDAKAPAKRGTRRTPRRSAGGNEERVLELVHERPGISVADVATSMGIGTTYLYRVLPRLEREGKVRKQGRGYHPVSDRAPI
jgi:DNA invertase Pin-like site-specific DNA recombinase